MLMIINGKSDDDMAMNKIPIVKKEYEMLSNDVEILVNHMRNKYKVKLKGSDGV